MAITCKNCGQTLPDNTSFCSHCGTKVEIIKFCPKCGTELSNNSSFCPNCGERIGAQSPSSFSFNAEQYAAKSQLHEKKIIAGLLGLLLGGLGIHYFYINKPVGGIVSIVLSICSCGIWSFLMIVQGIRMLIMDDEEFKTVYLDESKQFPIF